MKQRLQWIDIAKGITIVLMVLGHTSIPARLSNIIWSFHMPLFFIVSGMLTNWTKDDVPDFIEHRVKTLLLPFTIYSVIVLTVFVGYLDGNIVKLLSEGWGGYALWFIPVMFVASILCRLLYLVKNKVTRLVAAFIILCIGCILCLKHLFITWNMSSVPFAAVLMYLGTELKPIYERVSGKLWISILFLSITICISQQWRLDMCYNSIMPIVPLTIAALSGTFVMFEISKYIEKYSKLLTRILASIGRETFVILAFSQVIIMLFNTYLWVGSIVKYLALIFLLVGICYVKNFVVRVFRRRT